MEMPHERWGIVFCPRFCPFWRDFWVKCGKVTGEWMWHPEFSPCELDETLNEAKIIWQENFVFDTPSTITGRELHDLIEKWLRTTPFLGLTQLEWLNPVEYPYDDYTKVESVTLTSETAQIIFSRPCPVFFARKFIETIGITSLTELFSEQLKRVPPRVRFLVPPATTHFTGRLEAVISHLRQDPVTLGGIVPKEFFKGFLLPITEATIQHRLFLDFMKNQFPDWRYQSR